MLHGTAEYGFKAGGSLTKEFAVRAELVREGSNGEWHWAMRFYQVYLVSVVLLWFLSDASEFGSWGADVEVHRIRERRSKWVRGERVIGGVAFKDRI